MTVYYKSVKQINIYKLGNFVMMPILNLELTKNSNTQIEIFQDKNPLIQFSNNYIFYTTR